MPVTSSVVFKGPVKVHVPASFFNTVAKVLRGSALYPIRSLLCFFHRFTKLSLPQEGPCLELSPASSPLLGTATPLPLRWTRFPPFTATWVLVHSYHNVGPVSRRSSTLHRSYKTDSFAPRALLHLAPLQRDTFFNVSVCHKLYDG